jgi:hypothetical protein
VSAADDYPGMTALTEAWTSATKPTAQPEAVRAMQEIDRLRGSLADLERTIETVIGERDRVEEWADALAYAIAPESDIGEHSSSNNPWANALDRAGAAYPQGGRS